MTQRDVEPVARDPVAAIAAPFILFILAPGTVWRLSLVFAGFVVGNFALVSVAGAIVGRYIERASIFAGLNGTLLASVLLGIFLDRMQNRHISHINRQ